ncbi:tyrosine-type recombinase/integrase [Micromonospora sp. NBC_00858]|uniref:tyrosine-type recombinase/integrase n=1 Tax=Micromonospora sp. NBC_00858 TaxID=2975979 RepID=UPI00386CC319
MLLPDPVPPAIHRTCERRRARSTAWCSAAMPRDCLDPANFSHRFSALCKRAGLGHWHPHDLRHSGASLMLAQGTPLHVVSEVLGHTRIASRRAGSPAAEPGAGSRTWPAPRPRGSVPLGANPGSQDHRSPPTRTCT